MTRAWLLLLVVAGCGGTMHAGPSATERPIGEDLLALLPSGADAVIDVEMAQLDGWPTARRLLALVPDDGRAQLSRLGDDPLAQISALAIAVDKAGTPDAGAVTVARGAFDWEHLRGTLPGAVESDYHGTPVLEGSDGQALARVTPTVFAFGTRVTVRRVLDVARKEDDSLRISAVDKRLRDALGRAPTAKLGRPAVMAALVPTEPLRERLRAEKWWAAGDLDWVALSLAVGDGFDVGLVVGTHGPVEAGALAKTMKQRAGELKTQAMVRMLGLGPYIDPFVVVARDNEVHVAYRLGALRVDQLVTRLEQLRTVAQKKAARP
jgi:hypothetical protein